MLTVVKRKFPLINREISWLYFNERVLQEAADKTVPLMERLRFLAIFSSNLDEFYRVRVATLNRLVDINNKTKTMLGFNPKKLLNEIKNIVVKLEKRFDYLYEQEIIKELEARKIFIINEHQLNVARGAYVRGFFRQQVLPTLVPIMLEGDDSAKPFPELKDRHIYFIVKLTFRKKVKYALIEIPTSIFSRFLILPENKELKFIILLDDIIRYCLDDLFFIFEYDTVEAYSIQLTRDAELDIDANVSEKFVDALMHSLQRRDKGRPMRLLYDSDIPLDTLNYLVSRMQLDQEALIPGGRYHNFKDFVDFPNVGGEPLEYPPMTQLRVNNLDLSRSIFSQMAQRDYLVSLPYQSFDYIVHFLREAAIDPKVKEINICLYRLAENSSVINALINAAQNGKTVNCLLELKARFDEEANIYWRNRLEEGGVNVNIGVVQYKVHAKVCLVTRREKRGLVYYANLATGNFNEKTAKHYCDHSLFTIDPLITKDLKHLFKGLEKQVFYNGYKSIITSPLGTRQRLYQLIANEIEMTRLGKKGYLILKMNSLSDEEMIEKLYEANNAGVTIQLIIRGMCCLVPGQEGFSERITVRSIVDRYLEHARVWIFGNGGDELMYLSSADLMTRNIDRRVEVAFPILDARIRKEIRDIIDIQLRDNTKAREINQLNNNRYIGAKSKIRHRAQEDIYNYLKYKS
ncbi:polyphosphate kinase [Parapedobacter pyrenivorans]|uniref:Polyphosphate kinase n=1 Tax=Parapedobacter pyrenivorans TaxID=1305674 RepID=A0A917I370_9SPHI|nr:polyphosphate kinase 1 [Parapedobacter pyrenivorans]GGH04879.1 polyphosphate kinase [Parapedobacter pyrenivorans]